MSNICKRRCLEEDRTSRIGYGDDERKRCGRCEYFIVTDDMWCFCCGQKYRTKPKYWKMRHDRLEIVRRN